jgi:anti-sigma factor RsiW
VIATSHPTAADLFSYASGDLDRAEHAGIEAHVQSCPHCLNVLALLPDAPLLLRARKAVREVSTSDPTPMPQPAKKVGP